MSRVQQQVTASTEAKHRNNCTLAGHPACLSSLDTRLNATPPLTLQAKLVVGRSDDPLEREADQVADLVMRMPEPRLQRKADKVAEPMQAKPLVQRRVTGSESGLKEAPPIVHEVLHSPGRSLEPSTRHFMESRFGYDFSQIRVHTGTKADVSARTLGARAYTAGKDVVFRNDQYQPSNYAGRRLLSHELAHTIQQGRLARGEYKVQCDLAITPQGSGRERALSPEDIRRAIDFNRRRFPDPYSLMIIRDVVGIPKYPAVSDKALVLGVARWQADQGVAQDGMVGVVTLMLILEELQAEGQDHDAQLLRADFQGHRGLIPDINTSHCRCRSLLQREISSSNNFITVYQLCGADPAITTGEQVEDCVDDHFASQGVRLETVGSTSASGRISIARQPGPCGPLLEQVTRAHEQVHGVHTRELRQLHHSESEYQRAYSNKSDWVTDEVNARRTDIATARFVLEVLDGMCA